MGTPPAEPNPARPFPARPPPFSERLRALLHRSSLRVSYPLTALISDLHSNEQALLTALGDAADRGAERYVCLGDVIGYGARPVLCLDWVMRLCSEDARDTRDRSVAQGLCLMGNHEHALLESAEDFNPRARAAIEWTRSAISAGRDGQGEGAEEYWNFIGDLKPTLSDDVAQFAHGSPRDPVREYMLPSDAGRPDKMRAVFAAQNRPVCFVGHSHVPFVYYSDGRMYRPKSTEGPYRIGASAETKALINVGSVGQPRDGDTRLSYCLFDGERITFVRLPYEVEGAQSDIRAVEDLPEYLADRLGQGR